METFMLKIAHGPFIIFLFKSEGSCDTENWSYDYIFKDWNRKLSIVRIFHNVIVFSMYFRPIKCSLAEYNRLHLKALKKISPTRNF